MKSTLVATLGVSVLLSAPPTLARAAEGQLTSTEIQSLLANSTASGVTPEGKAWSVDYGANGEARLTMQDGGQGDEGRWRVYENRYCAKWRTVRNGAEQCWYVEQDASGGYTFKGLNGAADMQVEILPTERKY